MEIEKEVAVAIENIFANVKVKYSKAVITTDDGEYLVYRYHIKQSLPVCKEACYEFDAFMVDEHLNKKQTMINELVLIFEDYGFVK